MNLMIHHLGHDALPGVRGLYRYVGHAGYESRIARDGHLDPVRVGAADNLSVF
jgi:hypothetical protein